MRPVCQITYRRTARVSYTPAGPIRLTFDEAVRAIPVEGIAFVRFRTVVRDTQDTAYVIFAVVVGMRLERGTYGWP